MSNKCQGAFEDAAKTIAHIPGDYLPLNIKDNIPVQRDWDDLNSAFCWELDHIGCTVVESELDPFWRTNKTFRQLLDYVSHNCACAS